MLIGSALDEGWTERFRKDEAALYTEVQAELVSVVVQNSR